MLVEKSYEEQIMEALANLPRIKGEHFLARGQREHAAIRAVLHPMYSRLAAADRSYRSLRSTDETAT